MIKLPALVSWKWKLTGQRLVWAVAVGLVEGAMLGALWWLGLAAGWQDSVSDMMFEEGRGRGEIVMVAIDDESLTRLGRWPWDRNVHARVIDFLTEAKASVIGYDVLFAEEAPAADDRVLSQAVARAGNVVLAGEAQDLMPRDGRLVAKSLLLPIQQLKQIASYGVVNVVASGDGVVRHMPFVAEVDQEEVSAFWAAIVKQWYQARGENSKFAEIAGVMPLEEGAMRISFAGGPGVYPKYSVVDVLDGRVSPDVFTDKIVVVGAVSPSLHDDHLTPVRTGQMPGLEVHANAIGTFLGRDFLVQESRWRTLVTLIGLCLVGNVVLVMLSIKWGLVVVIGGMIGYIIYSVFSFDGGVIRNLVFPVAAIAISGVSSVAEKYFLVRRQRNYVRRAMGYYLSPAVMGEIMSDPGKLTLGGQRRKMSVLFVDIAGFTSLSEKLPPEVLSRFLNDFLTRASQVVYAEDGVVDKYIGDGMMAFWGAPIAQDDHGQRACRAALSMVAETEKMKQEWAEEGVEFAGVRVGINSGEMVVGNMGSQERFDYTAVGDNVNIGARLEGLGKYYGVSVVVSGATRKAVGDDPSAGSTSSLQAASGQGMAFRKLDRVVVKGKSEPMVIYGLEAAEMDEGERKQRDELFESARKLYTEGKFGKAVRAFAAFLKDYPGDGVAELFLARCERFARRPPENWDGVFRFEVK